MVAGQWHLDAETYLEIVRAEVPSYDDLQDRIANATKDLAVSRVLDLGCGTGETGRRVLQQHPGATLVGVDSSPDMLSVARRAVPDAIFVQSRLEDPLPEGPFDVIVSAFAVHHLPPLRRPICSVRSPKCCPDPVDSCSATSSFPRPGSRPRCHSSRESTSPTLSTTKSVGSAMPAWTPRSSRLKPTWRSCKPPRSERRTDDHRDAVSRTRRSGVGGTDPRLWLVSGRGTHLEHLVEVPRLPIRREEFHQFVSGVGQWQPRSSSYLSHTQSPGVPRLIRSWW